MRIGGWIPTIQVNAGWAWQPPALRGQKQGISEASSLARAAELVISGLARETRHQYTRWKVTKEDIHFHLWFPVHLHTHMHLATCGHVYKHAYQKSNNLLLWEHKIHPGFIFLKASLAYNYLSTFKYDFFLIAHIDFRIFICTLKITSK